uniref:Uncharacterized protein n=1 Tax=Rhizophora mucronata TaxID=61149 RepID=A0A2P2P7J1_RHIMU
MFLKLEQGLKESLGWALLFNGW